jgi:hypothetical protein
MSSKSSDTTPAAFNKRGWFLYVIISLLGGIITAVVSYCVKRKKKGEVL